MRLIKVMYAAAALASLSLALEAGAQQSPPGPEPQPSSSAGTVTASPGTSGDSTGQPVTPPGSASPASGAGNAAVTPPAPKEAPPIPKIDYRRYLANDMIGYAGLAVEKANIQKSLADEHYLRDDRKNAEDAYKRTLATLANEAPDDKLNPTQLSVKRLLRVDVDYRLLNLRLGNDFWSGYRTNRPSTPHRHLLVMDALLKRFETQVNDIEAMLTKLDTDATEQAKLAGMKITLEGQIKDQTLAQEKGVIEARKERNQLGTWEERVRNLTSQRLAVEAKSKQLAEEQKQLSANASSLLTQAIVAGTGIPPSIGTAVMTGDIKAALVQEAAAQLGDPNSELSKAVGQVSANAQKLQEFYNSSAKNYNELKTKGEQLKQAADLVRKPTFDNLVSAGNAMWNTLPEAEQQRLTTRVMQQVPTAGLLESYRKLELTAQDAIALRQRLEGLALDRIPNVVRTDLQTFAMDVIKDGNVAREKFQAIYKGISAIELTDAQYRTFIEHFLHIGAADLFAAIPEAQRIQVAWAMGEPSIEAAINKLANDGLSALPAASIKGKAITYKVSGKLSTVSFATVFASARFEKATSGLKDLPALYSDLMSVPKLQRLAVAQLPDAALGTSVEAELRTESNNRSQRETTWNALANGMSQQATQKARDALVRQALGAAVVEDVVKRPEAAPYMVAPLAYPASAGNSTGLSPEASAMATAALNYAVPGAGMVVAMARSFAKMDSNMDEMNRLADQSLRIMAEQEQLYDLATEAYFQYALAEVEQQRAEVLRDSAERQLSVFSAEINRRSNSAAKNHAGIGLRRALTYYLSERLREEFDLFDRSFAMWNSGLSARGAVAAAIQSDPQNVRYALDSDIHLFDWLNRERESTRGDPDTLRVHWRQMVQLAKDVCVKRGCKPGDNMLGQIAATQQLSAKTHLVSEQEWRRFKEWQANPGGGTFSLQFSILPGHKIVPLNYENVRIIDLRLAGAMGGTQTTLSQVSLRHSGIAQIPRAAADTEGGIVFQREALLARSSAAFNRPEDFDVNALRTRFEGPFNEINYPSLRDFEGYGLYAVYSLTLQNTPENKRIDDILMRIAYFYHDASNIISEERYLNSLRGLDTGLPFEIHDYKLVSRVTPSCAGEPGSPVEVQTTDIPASMRSSFITAFSRAAKPAEASELRFLPPAARRDLERLQSCLESQVVRVCKPQREIEMIAASWFAASKEPATPVRNDVFNAQSESNDQSVPKPVRDRYLALCKGGA